MNFATRRDDSVHDTHSIESSPKFLFCGHGPRLSTMASKSGEPVGGEGGKFYTLFIDGKDYQVNEPELTGGEIMDLGGIPHEQGLFLVHEDGSQEQVGVDQEIELEPGRRFKKAPRFVRG